MHPNAPEHTSNLPAAPARRRRGRQPTRIDILRLAASLTETTRTGVAQALRERGLVANEATVDAVLAAAREVDSRRRLRHWQNATRRLGRTPEQVGIRWPQDRPAPVLSLRQRLHRLRVRSIAATAKSLFRHGAAGGSSMKVEFAADSTEVGYWVEMDYNRNTYAGRFKGWVAREDHHLIRVPRDWRTRVLAKGLADLGGLMTLDAHRLDCAGEAELFAATWASQARGYCVQVHRGYIARAGDEHFHADTAEAALAGLRRRLRRQANLAPFRLSVEAFVRRYRGIDATVTLEDAYASGSCDYGIRSWCAAVGLDYGKRQATLTEVLDGFAKRPQVEVRRAVLQALRRQRVRLRDNTGQPDGAGGASVSS